MLTASLIAILVLAYIPWRFCNHCKIGFHRWAKGEGYKRCVYCPKVRR